MLKLLRHKFWNLKIRKSEILEVVQNRALVEIFFVFLCKLLMKNVIACLVELREIVELFVLMLDQNELLNCTMAQ